MEIEDLLLHRHQYSNKEDDQLLESMQEAALSLLEKGF